MPVRDRTTRRVRDAITLQVGARMGLGVRVFQRYVADGMLERAPAIAYYGILSLFPALLLTFAAVRLVAGEGAPADIAAYSREHGASGVVADALRDAAKTAQNASVTSASSAGLIGLLTLIYGASRAFTAVGRAVDAIAQQARLPRSVARRAQDIGWTLLLLVVTIVVVLLISVSGVVLEDLLSLVGLGGAAVPIWAVARWPVAAVLALLVVSIVRWAAPTGARRRFTLLSRGRLVTMGSLIVATAGFNVYLAHFADYNATYGTFTAAIILMLWMWMAASSILVGAEVDAVLDERDS